MIRVTRAASAGEVAEWVGGVVDGDAARAIGGIASLDLAGPDDLSFCSGGRWLQLLEDSKAGVLLVGTDMPVPPSATAIRVANPRLAYARAAALLVPLTWPEAGVHPTAWVHPTAKVEGATIGPFAVVEAGASLGEGTWMMAHAYVGEGVQTGRRCRLMPQSVVMQGSVLGDEVWLHPGAIIGADGFGQVVDRDGVLRVPQLGRAVIEDHVEIGANACVDRAALGETVIGRGSRLDNLVQVAHGARLGARNLLAAFAGVAGGAKLGDRVTMAGRTAVIDGITVGDDVVFAGLASASRDVPSNRRLGGSPARAYSTWLRETAALRQLPNALRVLNRIERQLNPATEDEP